MIGRTGAEGPGRPVVLIPGIGPRQPRRRNALPRRVAVSPLAPSFVAEVVDRPAESAGGTTIPQLAERYAGMIGARYDGPVDLIGISTGGSIALRLAIDHPHLLHRLVLVSAAFRLGDDGRAAQAAIAGHLRRRRGRRAAAVMLATTTTRPLQRKLRGVAGLVLGRLVLERDADDLIAVLEAENDFDAASDLSRVRAPTLVVGGGRDGYYSPELFEATAAGVPDGTLLRLPRDGHLGLGLHPAAARRIVQFLTAAEPTEP